MLDPHISRVERLLFRSSIACVGECRCHPDCPEFSTWESPRCSVIAFYRSTLWIGIEERRVFVADPTVATFHNAGQPYRRRKISTVGDHCEWIAIAPDVIRDIVAEHDPAAADRDPPFAIARRDVPAELFQEQRRLVTQLRASSVLDSLGIEERIVRLCRRLMADTCSQRLPRRTLERPIDAPQRRAIVEHVRAVLAAGYRDQHSLRSLARRAGCSPFHLCRIFHALSGTTLRRYVMELRLRDAFDQVTEGAEDLSALALDLGFSSHSHFTAAFRTKFGVQPSMIRRWRS